MKHLELLNDDVEYFSTYNLTPCCNSCDDFGGGCTCDAFVCGASDVCTCDFADQGVCTCNGICDNLLEGCGYMVDI